VVGDAENLTSFDDNSYDVVVSFSTLRFLENPQMAINEMYRVLKPNGFIVVDFPNKWNPWFNYLKPMLHEKKHIYDNQYGTKAVSNFLKTAKFNNIKIKRFLYTPKSLKSNISLSLIKMFELVGELPLLNNLAAIIMASGQKP